MERAHAASRGRRARRRGFRVVVLAMLAALAWVVEFAHDRRTQIFFHAHQDDWQLFMGDQVARAAGRGAHVVLVYLTAGDAGHGRDYWEAREQAALASEGQLGGLGGPLTAADCGSVVMVGQSLWQCRRERIVSYFLRLPDGNGRDGLGFARSGLGSLRRLREAPPADPGCKLRAVDDSACYDRWQDLLAVLSGIIAAETPLWRGWFYQLNAPESDPARNPGDHPDHIETGRAVRALLDRGTDRLAAARRTKTHWFMGYASRQLPPNLPVIDGFTKLGLFLGYDQVMSRQASESVYCPERPGYHEWPERTYYRRAD